MAIETTGLIVQLDGQMEIQAERVENSSNYLQSQPIKSLEEVNNPRPNY